jgi:hypothetical protein
VREKSLKRSQVLFSFVPHDREAADAIQIDRIEFIASPSFDIRIGF